MNFIHEVEKLLNASSDAGIDWVAIRRSSLGYYFQEMKNTSQNPEFHGEGDVYIHTRMVCDELIRIPAFWKLSEMQKIGLFAAGVFHDVGKIRTTKSEDGKLVSPNHSSTGSRMTREYLWQTCGLCGNKESIQLRELICTLVRYHMLPVHLIDQDESELKIRTVAEIGELVPEFSWDLLCILSEADMRGRIAGDMDEQLEKIELCRVIAEEAGCLDGPYHFNDSFTKHAYLRGRNVQPDQTLYDDTWGEVLLMSGLPGTGKDTWIGRMIPDYPMISLDDIRKEMRVNPTENQGIVIQEAQERAKIYLRQHQPFVWNATNITKDTRQKQIGLFERYGARVRVVYLETDWNTQKERNCSREAEVPMQAVEKMLGKTVLPTTEEAHKVEWICV